MGAEFTVTPSRVPFSASHRVTRVSAGWSHVIFLTGMCDTRHHSLNHLQTQARHTLPDAITWGSAAVKSVT